MSRRTDGAIGAGGARIAANILAVIGVAVGAASLFFRGWAHANVTFVAQGPSGAAALRPFGVDIDTQLATIADQHVNTVISPTMWQYTGHTFQWVFALLLGVAVLLWIASFPRARIAAHAGALLAGIAAAAVVLVAFTRVHDRLVALPESISRTIQSNVLLRQSFALTTGKPVVDGGPGWPIFAAVIGVALVVLGTLLGFVFALARPTRKQAPR